MKKNDVLLLALLILCGILISVILLLTGNKGRRVQISVGGKITESMDLNVDRVYDIQGYGGGHNRLVIQDGQAWIEEASCPDGLCVKMGHISRTGQSVVCLPNQVVVEITGGSGSEIDAVVR